MLSLLIYVYLICLYIRPQDWPGNFMYGFPVADAIVMPALILGWISISKQKLNVKMPQTLIIIVFIIMTFTTNMMNGHMDAANIQVMIFFKRFLIYLMILVNVDTPKKMKQVLFFSALLAVILSFQGLSQRINGTGWAMQRIHSRIGPVDDYELANYATGLRAFWIGLWDGPNVLAIAYLGSFPFCLENIFRPKRNIIMKVFYAVLFCCLYMGIYMTDSRGGFLTLMLICGIFFLLRYRKRWGIALVILVIPVIMAIAPGRMSEINTEESSAGERSWLWEQGLNIARAHPVFGVGKGQFSRNVGTGIISHSNYVENLAEMGFPGLVVYVALAFLAVQSSWIVFKRYSIDDCTHELYYLSRIMLLAIFANLFATFFVIMEHDFLYILWALSASVFVMARKEKNDLVINFKLKEFAVVISISLFLIFLIWLISIKEII